MRNPYSASAPLAVLLVGLVACGETPTAPAVAAAQQARVAEQPPAAEGQDLESMSDRELLIALMGKLEAIEARLDAETKAVYARIDSALAAHGSRVTIAAAARGGDNRPVDVEGQDGRAWDLEAQICVEAGVDVGAGVTKSIFRKPDPFVSGPPILLTEVSAAIDAGVGWDAVLSGHGTLNLEGGMALAAEGSGGVGASFTICNKGWEIRTQEKADNLALQAEAVGSRMRALAAQINLNAGSLDRALGAIQNGFGSPSLDPDLDALPLPADVRSVFMNPGSIRGELASRMWQLAEQGSCDPNLFGGVASSIIQSTCAVRGRMDPARFVDIFERLEGLDLSALDDLQDACGGRGLKDCMAALDRRISRVCDTAGTMRRKLQGGIFHSDDDFSLNLVEVILNRSGNDNVTVTGVPPVGWGCSTLIQS